ncbi:hypothetical protein DPMN_041210 [Dreissena polymorpha]|uniref:Uncharacterized protein n=1 Tax=Dreissena polymorpha TaxID=45954 RepID=A0A9D4CZ05_DREPO|nr:hypothetical protein DPMN_041210 [Dreissena polymorpha]
MKGNSVKLPVSDSGAGTDFSQTVDQPLTELGDRVLGFSTANLVSNSTACNTATGANGAEFSTLVKQAYTTCPPELHGHFEYAMEKPNTIECNDTDLNVTDHLDGCTDRTKLTITSTCPTSPLGLKEVNNVNKFTKQVVSLGNVHTLYV